MDSSKLRAVNSRQSPKQAPKRNLKMGNLKPATSMPPATLKSPSARSQGPKVSFGKKRSFSSAMPKKNLNTNHTPAQSQASGPKKTAPRPNPKRSPSISLAANIVKKPNPTKRKQIVQEFLTTEQDYVASLTLLRDLYYLPLKACPRLGLNFIDPKEVANIFYGFESVYSLNEEMLREMQMAKFAGMLHDTLGGIMERFGKMMILYVDYVNKYNLAVETINACKAKSKVFTNFLARTAQEPMCKNNTIGSFLIMPIQRVPRYKMLLHELLKTTEESHTDNKKLMAAFDTISKIATDLNSKKAMYDMQEKVQQMQQMFVAKTPAFLKENRTYIDHFEGYIQNEDFKIPSKELKKKKKLPTPEEIALCKCIVVLFSDILVWGVLGKKALYEQRGKLKLDTIVCAATKPKYTPSFYKYQVDDYFGFGIDTNDKGDLVTFYCTTNDKSDSWVTSINQQAKLASEEKMRELQRRHNLND